MGPAISEGSFKSTKPIYHLTRLAMESLKIFVLFLSHVFIYNMVGINKIATTFLAKPPP